MSGRLGNHLKMAKTDQERMGLFSEMGYTTIGDPYKSGNVEKPFNVAAYKGRQMMVGSTKSKTAYQTGYFGKTFDRIMEGEAYSDPVKRRRQDKLKEAQKNLSKAFVPSSVSKKACGMGSHYGTIGGSLPAFSATLKDREKYRSPGKNFTTNPSKCGTGYGYLAVTIGSYYPHQPEPYDSAKELRKQEVEAHQKKLKGGPFKLKSHPKDYFQENPFKADRALPPLQEAKSPKEKPRPFKPSSPAKKAGGCKAGTFDPYPKHSEDPYPSSAMGKADKGGAEKKIFRPSPGPKSTPTNSVIAQNVQRRMNVQNFRTAVPHS